MDIHGDGDVPPKAWASGGAQAQDDLALTATLDAARAGDEVGIRTLYLSLHPRLLRYLRHHIGDEAQDIASEVWLNLAQELPRFEGDASAFRALMFTVAHRRLVDHHRRAKRQVVTVPIDAAMDQAGSHDPEQRALEGIDARLAVQLLVEELPREQAEIVLLRVLGDLDVGQVAAIVGKSAGAVRVAQHRAIRRLQRRLERSSVMR